MYQIVQHRYHPPARTPTFEDSRRHHPLRVATTLAGRSAHSSQPSNERELDELRKEAARRPKEEDELQSATRGLKDEVRRISQERPMEDVDLKGVRARAHDERVGKETRAQGRTAPRSVTRAPQKQGE